MIEINSLRTCKIIEHKEVLDKTVQYPYLIPMRPMAECTGDVECMSSYVSRLADIYYMNVLPFAQKLTDLYVDPAIKHSMSRMQGDTLPGMNGNGLIAERMASVITRGTEGEIDGSWLTVLPLRFLMDKFCRGVLKRRKEWCSECWREDEIRGGVPYIRLHWVFQLNKICLNHGVLLEKYCPRCGDQQAMSSLIPRQWHCDRCGYELHKSQKSPKPSNQLLPQDVWVSNAIFRLIERVYSYKLDIEDDHVVQSMKQFLKTQKVGYKEFAQAVNVSPSLVLNLMSPGKRPFFPMLMDMCYRINVPVDQFILDQDNISFDDTWKVQERPHFVAKSNISKVAKKKLFKDLVALINENPQPPPSVSSFAKKHKISYTVLEYHFPKEYAELKKRYGRWERQTRRDASLKRIENLVMGALDCGRSRVYPSHRKLVDLGYVLKSDLRKTEITELLEAFQKCFDDLGIVQEN